MRLIKLACLFQWPRSLIQQYITVVHFIFCIKIINLSESNWKLLSALLGHYMWEELTLRKSLSTKEPWGHYTSLLSTKTPNMFSEKSWLLDARADKAESIKQEATARWGFIAMVSDNECFAMLCGVGFLNDYNNVPLTMKNCTLRCSIFICRGRVFCI